MKVEQIIGAYRAVQKLQQCEMQSFRDAIAVNTVRTALKQYIDVLAGEENKIISKHGGKMKEHKWTFPDSESERLCFEELHAMHIEDVTVDIPRQSIKIPGGSVGVRPADVACLLELMEVVE